MSKEKEVLEGVKVPVRRQLEAKKFHNFTIEGEVLRVTKPVKKVNDTGIYFECNDCNSGDIINVGGAKLVSILSNINEDDMEKEIEILYLGLKAHPTKAKQKFHDFDVYILD